MHALRLTDSWPVENVAVCVIRADGTTATSGDQDHEFRIASVAKIITTWACLVAVEEGIVTLDLPVGQPGCTLRHLLCHAGGYGFDGVEPIARPERTRIYSNTGIEMAATTVADAAGISFADYLDEAVLQPLGMTVTALTGSPAHRISSTAADLGRFIDEVRRPRLISVATAADAQTTHFPQLSGVLPGIGRFHRGRGLPTLLPILQSLLKSLLKVTAPQPVHDLRRPVFSKSSAANFSCNHPHPPRKPTSSQRPHRRQNRCSCIQKRHPRFKFGSQSLSGHDTTCSLPKRSTTR